MLLKPTPIHCSTRIHIPIHGNVHIKFTALQTILFHTLGYLLAFVLIALLYRIGSDAYDLHNAQIPTTNKSVAINIQPVALIPKIEPTHIPISAEELAIASYIKTVNKKASSEYALDLAKTAVVYGKKHNHDPLLLVALMKVESSFNSDAISKAGAKGLTQVIPRYHTVAMKGCGGLDLHDVTIGICTGSKVLSEYLAETGSLETALAVYNGGYRNPQYSYSNNVIDAYRTVVKRVKIRA